MKKDRAVTATKTFARMIARRAWEKHAEDILLLDLRGRCDFCNYFLLLSGRNRFHLRSLREITERLAEEKGIKALGVEGNDESGWVLLDYGTLVVHLFVPETRKFYDLAHLWGDARAEVWDEAVLFPKGRKSPKPTPKGR